MNQKLLLALIFSLFSSLLFSQNDYIKYYQLINKVKQHQNNKKNGYFIRKEGHVKEVITTISFL